MVSLLPKDATSSELQFKNLQTNGWAVISQNLTVVPFCFSVKLKAPTLLHFFPLVLLIQKLLRCGFFVLRWRFFFLSSVNDFVDFYISTEFEMLSTNS